MINLKRNIPTVKVINGVMILKIPMIVVYSGLIGLGAGILLGACQNAMARMN